MPTFSLDWSESNLGGDAIVSYSPFATLDFVDKPTGATAALCLYGRGLNSINDTIASFSVTTTAANSALAFQVRTSSEGNFDYLRAYVDGTQVGQWSGETSWTPVSLVIAAAAAHTIEFKYSKDSSVSGGQDKVWVALLSVENATYSPPALPVASYDFEDGLVPASVNSTTWTNSTSSPINGTRSMRSPAVTADSSTYDLTVTKPVSTGYSVVAFNWKVSSQGTSDPLIMYVLNAALSSPAQLETKGGEINGRIGFVCPPSQTVVTVRYQKDASLFSGQDAAWIDGLTIPAAPTSGSLALSGSGFGKGAAGATGALSIFVPPPVPAAGAGTLSLAGAGIFVEYHPAYILLSDPVVVQPPSTLAVSMSGFAPLAVITLRIDGTVVTTVTADSQGAVIGMTLAIDRSVTAGSHTLSATSSTRTATASFSVTTRASALPASTAVDVSPALVPTAVNKWVFQDPMPGGLGSWVMPISPSAMTSPHVRKNVSASSVTAVRARPHVSVGARPVDWEFSGFCPDQAYQDKLLAYAGLSRRFYVIDHRQRAWTVAITGLDIKPRKRSIDGAGVATDWQADYTVKLALFSQAPVIL